MKIWLVSGVMGGLLLTQAHPAHAYWDDVHYHLTYFTARLVGCTPEQAYRLAAADLSTDYAPATEPTQFDVSEYFGTGSGDAPEKQLPRWRYHAFRNQTNPAFKESVGNGPGAAEADAAIKAQATSLFQQGTRTKNIGVFLHFAQDREPHRGFGSAWGHYFNPKDPVGSTERARKAGLRLGGTVDWLSAHPKLTTLNLLYNTGSWIDKFLATASPRQHRRGVALADSEDMIDALYQLNPAPAPLDLAELPLYQKFLESASPLSTPPALTPTQKAKFAAHKNGPNLSGSEKLIVAQMKKLGMMEGSMPPLAKARHEYKLTSFGNPQGDDISRWGVVGSLKLTIQGSSASDTQPVDVIIKAPVTMAGETEYDLVPLTKMKPGVSETFDNMPVGDVIIEVQRKGKTLVNARYKIDEPKNETTIKLRKGGLTGRWTTDEGWILTLDQEGDQVTGSYRGEGGVSGTVAGKFDGEVFAGAYVHHEGAGTYKGTFTSKLDGEDKLDGVWTETEHGVSQNITARRGK